MTELTNYRAFQAAKKDIKNGTVKGDSKYGSINDMLTTPLHIAAECSNIEAVRTLI